MHRLIPAILVLLAALIACTPTPAPRQGYRRDAPITSIVFFDPARFAGDWYEVAAFRPDGASPCSAGRSRYVPNPDGSLSVTEHSCARSDAAPRQATAVPTGPGRLTVTSGSETDIYWILWVDDGYRTAVIGMPSGKLGFILNRDAEIPPDRLTAAREILAWNGYDLGRLSVTGRR